MSAVRRKRTKVRGRRRETPIEMRKRDNKRSAAVDMQKGYAFMHERRMRTDTVTRGDDKRACMEQKLPEVTTSASNQEKRTIRKPVPFSKQPPKARPIENTTPMTPKAAKVLGKKAPALDTGNYEVLRSSLLD